MKGATNTFTNTDLQRDAKIFHPIQKILSNSNPRCESGLLIWAHWLKDFPYSSRGMEGQTWVPQEYHSLLFPSSSNKPRQPGEIQAFLDISFHRAHSWGSWAGWLFCGHFECSRCIQHSSWPAKKTNVNLRPLGPGFVKQWCVCLISCMWLPAVGLNHVFSRDWEAPGWETFGLLPCKEQPFHIECNTHLHLWFDQVI